MFNSPHPLLKWVGETLHGPEDSRRTRSRRGAVLVADPLEGRQLMSVDINYNAYSHPSAIVLTGDQGDNRVEVKVERQLDSVGRPYDQTVIYRGDQGRPLQRTVIDPRRVTRITFFGDAGADLFVNTTAIPVEVYGGDGDDCLYGGAGADYLQGNQGNDYIDGRTGADSIRGGQGDDYIEGGRGDDEIYGDLGNDTIYAGDGNDFVNGCAGSDVIYGQAGNDILRGGQDNDVLDAGSGNDQLYGDLGFDRLYGGAGLNYLYVQMESEVQYADRDDRIVYQ